MCGDPYCTSLLSPHPPRGLNVSAALLLYFQKLEQHNFPESHEAAPLAGVNQPGSHADSATGAGRGWDT